MVAKTEFIYEKIQKIRYADVYHKALCYYLGMNEDTRENVNSIYDFKTGCEKPECLHEGWQAIQIRYPEHATYNKNLCAMFGGND